MSIIFHISPKTQTKKQLFHEENPTGLGSLLIMTMKKDGRRLSKDIKSDSENVNSDLNMTVIYHLLVKYRQAIYFSLMNLK